MEITGTHRSGTTLFLSLLDGHGELLVYPEEPGFGKLLRRRYATKEALMEDFMKGASNNNVNKGRLSGLEDIQSELFNYDQYLSHLVSYIDRNGCAQNHIMLAAARAFAKASGQSLDTKKRWVFKQPDRAELVPWLFSTFPEAKVLHIVRDPRANYLAQRNYRFQRKGEQKSLTSFICTWLESAERARRNQKDFGLPKYAIVKYEDICLRPREMMGEIAEYLNIDFEDILVTPTKLGRNIGVATAVEQGHREANKIFTHSIDRWRNELSKLTIFFIESLCYKVMGDPRFQYQTVFSKSVLQLCSGIIKRILAGRMLGRRLVKGLITPEEPYKMLYRRKEKQILGP